MSEACWVPLPLGSGAWVTGFYSSPSLRALERAPGRNKIAGVEAAGSISVYESRGTFVHSYLPP